MEAAKSAPPAQTAQPDRPPAVPASQPGQIDGIATLVVLGVGAATVVVAAVKGLLKPGSLGTGSAIRPIDRVPTRMWTIWVFLGAVSHLISATLIAAGLVLASNAIAGTNFDLASRDFARTMPFITFTGIGMAVAAVVIWALLRHIPTFGIPPEHGDDAPMPWLRVRFKDILVGLLLVIPITGVCYSVVHFSLLGWQAVGMPSESSGHVLMPAMRSEGITGWKIGAIAGLVIGIPLAEELFFRGILQSALLSATRSPWIAVFISAIVFGLAHYGSVPVPMLAGLTAFGVFIGVVMEKRRSLATCVAIHAGFNGLSLLANALT